MIKHIAVLQKELRMSKQLLDIYPTIKADSHEEFLLILLKKLSEERYEKVKIKNMKNAGFGVIKHLDNYDFSQIHFPERLDEQQLKTMEFMLNHENLILYGGVGTGKTHLAIGLGVEAINAGKKTVFYNIQNMINCMQDKLLEKQVVKNIEQADLVILDEW